MSKLIGFVLLLGSLVFAAAMIFMQVKANYSYEQDYSSYWSLAEKASTIAQKAEYTDKFVKALDNSGLHGTNDALIWKTNNNSFDKNFEALKSLQTRLDEVKNMDANSFQYQTAIQQITAQEQGEAQEMLSVLQGCWEKVHYYWLWNPWLILLEIIIFALGVLIGFVLLMD